jgi:hypothetical protein
MTKNKHPKIGKVLVGALKEVVGYVEGSTTLPMP